MSKSTKSENTNFTSTVEKKITVEKKELVNPMISEGDKELDAIFGSRMRQRVLLIDQEDEEEEVDDLRCYSLDSSNPKRVEESSTPNQPSKSNRKRNKKNYASKGRNTFKEY
jgi:hypothetical protein